MVCPKIEMSHSRDMVRSGIYGQTVGEAEATAFRDDPCRWPALIAVIHPKKVR